MLLLTTSSNSDRNQAAPSVLRLSDLERLSSRSLIFQILISQRGVEFTTLNINRKSYFGIPSRTIRFVLEFKDTHILNSYISEKRRESRHII